MIADVVVGARPNFMKASALFAVAGEFPLRLRLLHTGQHYDWAMSEVFFKELGLPSPAVNLEVGSGSHALQTGEIIRRYGKWIDESRPDLCVVVGDVNSTLACALVASKERIPVAHVEAGLRSFDRSMPEEINRVLTDAVADWLFASEPAAVENLRREGRPEHSIHWVGNVMIDTLKRMRPRAESSQAHVNFGLQPGGYAYLTLHRPSNVDEPATLGRIMSEIGWLAERIPVFFSVHPRTRPALGSDRPSGILFADPMGYLESLSIVLGSRLVVTDSGGLQEETSALGIPCLTLRENTERPITVEAGTNRVIGRDWGLFRASIDEILGGRWRAGGTIPKWDGGAGRRILEILARS
jgi:UDP-N-acetylglucosamine 2-epimerase (non-hydrolysing)